MVWKVITEGVPKGASFTSSKFSRNFCWGLNKVVAGGSPPVPPVG